MTERARIGILSCAVASVLGGLVAVGCGDSGPQSANWKLSASLPADFPKDVPIYPGATVKHAVTPDSGSGMVVIWETPDKVPAVQEYLNRELQAQGWKVAALPKVAAPWLGERGTTLVATRWGRQVSLSLGEHEGNTAITFVTSWKP
jgi:hypothetical protein